MHFSTSLVALFAAAVSAQEAQQPSANSIATITRSGDLLNLEKGAKIDVDPDVCVSIPKDDKNAQYVNVAASKDGPNPECTFFPTPNCDGNEHLIVTKTFLVPYGLDFVPGSVICTGKKD
ncbi:hypothetical protein FE257_005154 [Aspergillus nanangensis]|uniref:Uncharacterized protein n=1 Tax=Aspergillus nanangensis TaxID=2582783 RepID=A0AAD4CAD8_ASPNN|nr:hypothetical protein FE257_005154 [Aspergillus nanangensis]